MNRLVLTTLAGLSLATIVAMICGSYSAAAPDRASAEVLTSGGRQARSVVSELPARLQH